MNSPLDVLHWMYSNAPAAWISAFAAIATLLYVLSNRIKPQKIIVREVGKSSLTQIWPNVRAKITMAFAGNKIGELGQIDLDILNAGSKVIQNSQIELTLPQHTTILDVHATPGSSSQAFTIDKNSLLMKFDWLNPFHEHKQVVAVAVLVDGAIGPVTISGMGEGWSCRHEKLQPRNNMRSRFVEFGMIALYMLVSVVYIRWAGRKFGIDGYEISWRALRIIQLPPIILAAILTLVQRIYLKSFWRQPRAWQID